ncbi:hypothetical protein HZS_7268 [Henneguya salminicola]|nr:hypothetical protein HZS_7268 [Henneguya salminicola]
MTNLQIINSKIKCKCNVGYKGKYCNNLSCPNDCNGNGNCVSPGVCLTHAKMEAIRKFYYLGICRHTNNSIQCDCPHDKITGKYCQILYCGKKCLNGKCIFLKNKNIKPISLSLYVSASKADIIDFNQSLNYNHYSIVIFNVSLGLLILTLFGFLRNIHQKPKKM